MEKQKLPNATTVLVLAIFSIVTCCCFGIFGIIFSTIALLLARKDLRLYNENPDLYTNFNNLKTGRILAIIGLVISIIWFLRCVYVFATLGPDGFQEAIDEFNRAYNEAQQQQR